MNLRHTLVGSVVPIVWALCLFLTGSGVAAAAPGLGGQSAPATLSLSPEALVFDTQVGRADASQFTDISVTSNDGSPVYVATVRTGSDWLTVGSVDSGNTISWGQSVVGQMPGTVRVFAKYGNLLPGIHFGTIAISPVEAPDSPVILPITVNVRARTTLLLRPNVLNFQYQAGYKANYPQPQSISLFGNKTSFSTLISSDSSLGWLSISPRTSVTPAILTVAVSPSGLPVGVYQATVAVVAPDAINSGVTFTVVLTVTDSATSTILPSSLSLRAPYGSHQPVFGSLSIYTNSTPFAISAAPAAGVPWLSVQTVDQWAGAADGKTGAVLPTPGIVRVWADPTGLAVGNYTSSVIIGDTATSTPVHVTLKINPNDLIIPQVADGGGWNTVITLVNTDLEPAPFTLKFWSPDGKPLLLPLDGIGSVSEYSDTIAVGGTRVIQTTGTDSATSQGWAEVVGQRALGGTATFRRNDVNGESEAAVSIAPPLGRQLQLPFDNTNSFQTGLAVVNPALSESTVTLNMRDENGDLIGSDSMVLPARGHDALLIHGRYPQLANRRGVIELDSPNADLSAIGLRFNPAGSFTSFVPVIPQAAGTDIMTRTIPQVADGSGWQTIFVLANPGVRPVQFSIVFRDPVLGAPMALPLANIGTLTEYADVLPVGGVRIFETDGTSSGIAQGWAEIVSSGPIGGTIVFGQSGYGTPASEATVQILPPCGERFVFPFDNTSGFSTGLALLNRSASRNYLATVTLRDESGQRLTTEYLQLNAMTDMTFLLSDLYPSTQNVRGSIEFFGADVSALGLLFNPMGSFTSMEPIQK